MSAALVRQALEFVDPEEIKPKNKRNRGSGLRNSREVRSQDLGYSYKPKNKKKLKSSEKSKVLIAEENIQKLLALSKPVANTTETEKIIARAVKGRLVSQKIQVVEGKEKSILFADEDEDSDTHLESDIFSS